MADEKYSMLRAQDAMQVRGLEAKREYVASLEARGDEQALSLLVECLCDESAFLRGLAEAALVQQGPRAVEVLLPHLTQGLWFTRVSVARVLGEIGARPALEGLVELAGDSNRSVVEAAVEALARLAAAGHVVGLARALRGAPTSLVDAVVATVGRHGGELPGRLARALEDEDLMGARADDPASEGGRPLESPEGVEWELLTGRAGAAPAPPAEPPADQRPDRE